LFDKMTAIARESRGAMRKETIMKSYALTAAMTSAAFAAMLSLTTPVQAQTYDPSYPVCLQIYQGGIADYYFECHYRTMAQCQMSASGRAAQCVVNPYYAQAQGPSARKRYRNVY